MLQSLFKRAEATVDNAIASILTRTLIALPFLVAAGFATAAATLWLCNQLGLIWGLAAMAGGFVLLGGVTAAAFADRSRPHVASGSAEGVAATADTTEHEPGGAMERDVAMAALTAVAPVALQAATRIAFRNLPLVAAVGAAAFILSRPGEAPSQSPMQPAE